MIGVDGVGVGSHQNPFLPYFAQRASICTKSDLDSLSAFTVRIKVNDNCGNDPELTELNLTRFAYLEEVSIGDNCFAHVIRVEMVKLSHLDQVSIGSNSFSRKKYEWRSADDSRFVLKDCDELRTLKIGSESFFDFKTCEIKNNPSLKTIRIGLSTEAMPELLKSVPYMDSNTCCLLLL